ncbi:hypothetical protein [Nonlabens ponticola]|uniref:Uncharacterized protein n=1 Tax=Nonlabens ponticola TaxID=2496866 RepID=A0A3S9MW15_9FLAO|nr:hypothetical protein [Nonlabens ponticola]AZQ43334.1 hypothetical protein EJ995_03430 [Nonlabens ponticola]
MKSYILFVLAIVIPTIGCAQSGAVDEYKYVVVDNQYEWQNEANQYRQNELMEFLLEKYGFNALRNNQVMPEDLNRGTCNALALKMDKSGTLRVDLDVWLEDCNGNKVFTTKTGTGRTKDYKIAYNEAIREAFESFEELDYEYTPNSKEPAKINPLTAESPTLIANKATAEKRKVIQKEIEVKEVIEDIKNELPNENDPEVTNEPAGYSNRLGYKVIFNDSKGSFEVFLKDQKIGRGRKSTHGVYLLYTNDFSGIAYMKGDVLVLEYEATAGVPEIMLLTTSN